MYHYFYKITNKINGHYYYGVHSTENLNDGYMGSGKRLFYAKKKYGIQNFSKEILKFFDTKQEAYDYEQEVVTEELMYNNDCYNIITGGNDYMFIHYVYAIDKNGEKFYVNKNDERLLTGELTSTRKNKLLVIDKNGNYYTIDKSDNRYKNGEFVAASKNTILVKDSSNNLCRVSTDDYRYKSGELTHFWVGRHHSDESKRKMSETHKRNKDQQGENNSQYGKRWIHKNNENKVVMKDELQTYIDNGWEIGRYVDQSAIKYPMDDIINYDDILKMREQGLTLDEISKILGISRKSIYRYRKRHDLLRDNKR